MKRSYLLSWWLYGLIVIASGCYRYFSRPDGEKGLYFGLVMGGAALLAAWLLQRGHSRAGHVAGSFSLVFVTGWFLFESLIKDGGSYELRLLLVAAISLIQACVMIRSLIAAPRDTATGSIRS